MFSRIVFLSILFLSAFGTQVSAQSTYTIPDDLIPVVKWAKGFSAEESRRFASNFTLNDGDFFRAGLNTQGIYLSPARDIVIAYFP